jgi:hypothetical protein
MRPWIPGAAVAAAVVYFYPSSTPLPDLWTVPASSRDVRTDSTLPAIAILQQDTAQAPVDSASVPPDPFGLPLEPASAKPTAIGSLEPPPPRPWSATGRVGQRAAVLTATDGRILVVSDGSRVDSAVVVSIGTDGVVLEDRGGRFVLRIP